MIKDIFLGKSILLNKNIPLSKDVQLLLVVLVVVLALLWLLGTAFSCKTTFPSLRVSVLYFFARKLREIGWKRGGARKSLRQSVCVKFVHSVLV